jgi:hypothetical protein
MTAGPLIKVRAMETLCMNESNPATPWFALKYDHNSSRKFWAIAVSGGDCW